LEDWALIRRLAAEGVPKARIAERLGISRTTVIKAVQSESPPSYERQATSTSFTPFEARVRALLEDDPELPAVVIAERVGWTGSITWFRQNVKRLRPEHRKIDPADRLSWEPGDAAQCDLWFPPRKIPLEDGTAKLLPVLVITAAYSRFILGQMIPTRQTEDLLLGSWQLIQQLGRVPRRLIWISDGTASRNRCRNACLPGRVEVWRAAAEVRPHLSFAATWPRRLASLVLGIGGGSSVGGPVPLWNLANAVVS